MNIQFPLTTWLFKAFNLQINYKDLITVKHLAHKKYNNGPLKVQAYERYLW